MGVPLVAGDTDAEANRFATTPYQRFLQLIRGEALHGRPPVENMEELWSPHEKALVQNKLGIAVIGGPETVRQKLAALSERTQADEFIFTSDLYRHSDRLRSFEIVADVMKGTPVEASLQGLPR